MTRIQRWDTTVECGRTVPTGECEGRVRIKGYYDPGSMYGGADNLGSPPEGESSVGACNRCGWDDWTDEEIRDMTTQAQEDSDE